MRYIPNSAEGQQEMLRDIGVRSLEDLFVGIPQELRLKSLLNLPPALSEPELIEKFKSYADKNASGLRLFLGAGVNDHYIPTVIDSLISRGEFLTSYTPYQAEITQGTLQAIFEFQTLMCQLTGMEVSNASMYDGSTALTEAILMAARVGQRNRFLIASSVHPEYRAVVNTYARHQDLTLTDIEAVEDGTISIASLEQKMGCRCCSHRGPIAQLLRQSGTADATGRPGPSSRCVAGGCRGRRRCLLGLLLRRDPPAPTLCAAKRSRWEFRRALAVRMSGFSPAAKSSYATFPGGSLGRPWIRKASAALSSRFQPASNTSAARRPPPTSAPTKACLR
jgi:hypothetical protein